MVIDEALERRRLHNDRTILFVDEVHRWNKAQQDALLPHVENGTFTLIGATTENPYFEVIKALISRSRVFQLRNLNQTETGILIDRALTDKERGYGNKKIKLHDDARTHLIEVASGDARNALNAIELAVESTSPNKDGVIHITLDVAQNQFNAAPCCTIKTAMRTTIRSAPSSNLCAEVTPMRLYIGLQR